jgi:pimeloyl-ACP methyl ester carboxylesterase
LRLLRTSNAGTPTQDVGRWHPPERRLRVGSATHRVATWGQGPPLLLLNGIGGNIEMWEALALRLPGRQLIMIAMPGTGGSPALRLPLRMSGYATLVIGVLDQLGIERTDVLGYSWGGALAQQPAHHAPGRVRALVLAATVPGLGGHRRPRGSSRSRPHPPGTTRGPTSRSSLPSCSEATRPSPTPPPGRRGYAARPR